MAVFPSLAPQVRSYTPASHPNTPIEVLTGAETSVRHSNASTGNRLRLTFNGITQETKTLIIAHYSFHARFIPFDLAAITLYGSGITLPANYQWIYADIPQVDENPGVIAVTVELELIPPYTL